jgi:uncharacterized membrane protein YsdA (DUF1294 family)
MQSCLFGDIDAFLHCLQNKVTLAPFIQQLYIPRKQGVGMVFFDEGNLPWLIAGGYLLMSIVAFIAYALDKSAAKNNRWRTPESTLHLLGLLGGWPGALLAQRWLRHKSKKTAFLVVFWATVLINCAVLLWVLLRWR